MMFSSTLGFSMDIVLLFINGILGLFADFSNGSNTISISINKINKNSFYELKQTHCTSMNIKMVSCIFFFFLELFDPKMEGVT